MKKNNIGIFGGTFDPVHRGHVAIAEAFIKELELDILYVIPNNIPPMKENNTASGEDRIKMLELAFAHTERVKISTMELEREGTSYTCDTIAEIRSRHPEDRLFLLTGDDWIGSFHKWKRYEYILDNASLVVGSRSERDIKAEAERFREATGKEMILLDNPVFEASSTQIRRGLLREALPEQVYEYIKKRGLYGI